MGSRRPDRCQFCKGSSITKDRDGNFVCEDCGLVIKHSNGTDEEVPYLQ